METLLEQNPPVFVDRRSKDGERPLGVPERRQFRSSHDCNRPAVTELANAVDQYKLSHRRRFITYEELYDVIAGLGYVKADQ
uniref:Uncharacterized protein n=1 Tax=Schlesneria paludicola TaxID=360056 RepID=A0A7C2K218_9PLAN